ncbi:MAG: MmgE/PrpD family protein [Betaproteobacteria bacterium]
MSHAVERLAAWAVQSRSKPLQADVLHHAKRAVIDWYAAYYPGSVVAPATLLEKAFSLQDPRTRALIHGTAAHTAEVDDIFRDGIYHPGAPTISAALAVARSRKLSGMDFLRAVVVGYEISTRIGAAMGRAHYEHWHNTGTIGCFGACAAVSELLGLDEKSFSHALATVTTFSAGLQQAFRMDSMSKPLHAGRAAEAGVTAALAAEQGVTGSLDVLQGFGKAMGDDPDWSAAFSTLGRDWHITCMTFKNHACCGHTFAAIDGALALKARMKLAAEDIERVRVGTYRAGVEVAHYEQPATPAEGRFSLKYVVATALTYGSVRLAAFEEKRLSDRTTRDLMQKISVGVDPELDATFPRQRAARVAIEARGGRREEILHPTRKGDPDLQLSDREVEEKYLELASPVIGADKAKDLLQRLWKLEALPQLP